MKFYEFYGDSEGTAICLGDFDGMPVKLINPFEFEK